VPADGQGAEWHKNTAENFNRLSRVHERYRRQTDGRQHMANVNVLKTRKQAYVHNKMDGTLPRIHILTYTQADIMAKYDKEKSTGYSD